MQYYKERKHLLLRSWQCDREELVVKTQTIFADAWEQYNSYEKLHSERLQQQKLCKKLHNKVRSFVGNKLTVLYLIDCCMAGSKTRDASIGDSNK